MSAITKFANATERLLYASSAGATAYGIYDHLDLTKFDYTLCTSGNSLGTAPGCILLALDVALSTAATFGALAAAREALIPSDKPLSTSGKVIYALGTLGSVAGTIFVSQSIRTVVDGVVKTNPEKAAIAFAIAAAGFACAKKLLSSLGQSNEPATVPPITTKTVETIEPPKETSTPTNGNGKENGKTTPTTGMRRRNSMKNVKQEHA